MLNDIDWWTLSGVVLRCTGDAGQVGKGGGSVVCDSSHSSGVTRRGYMFDSAVQSHSIVQLQKGREWERRPAYSNDSSTNGSKWALFKSSDWSSLNIQPTYIRMYHVCNSVTHQATLAKKMMSLYRTRLDAADVAKTRRKIRRHATKERLYTCGRHTIAVSNVTCLWGCFRSLVSLFSHHEDNSDVLSFRSRAQIHPLDSFRMRAKRATVGWN